MHPSNPDQIHCSDCDRIAPPETSTATADVSSPASAIVSSQLDGAGATRREFVALAGVAAASAIVVRSSTPLVAADPAPAGTAPASEQLVKKLYDSLSETQRDDICFPWDHQDDRGLLRMHVSNNWQITAPKIASSFFTKDQQDMIEAIFWGLYHPDWHDRIRKQLKDDAGGYGKQQSIALFGNPANGPFEFVMTGRHLTIRCDGRSTPHVAFGGPIFYGHAAQAFNEEANHPGNVFWPQALKANALFQMLDGKQREQALVANTPAESAVHFTPQLPAGIPLRDLTADQRQHAREVLNLLLEPYRAAERDVVRNCLDKQGGLEACTLTFYKEGDLGNDQVWDNWRIQGPAFVWYYRGTPHVHVWVHVADDPSVKITTAG